MLKRDTKIAIVISACIMAAAAVYLDRLPARLHGLEAVNSGDSELTDTPRRTTVCGPLGQKLISTIEDQILPEAQRLTALDTGAPIRGFLSNGFLESRPIQLMHSDYWLFVNSAKLFGMPLHAIAEEYEHADQVCCADRGLSVYFSESPATQELVEFAKLNRCEIESVDADATQKRVPRIQSGTQYTLLDCRESKRNP